jgi:biopolymer transport protein ExbB
MTPTFLHNGLELLEKGGWVMIPLLGLSIAAVTLVIERFLSIREAGVATDALLDEIRPLLLRRQYEEAVAVAASYKGPTARVIYEGIVRHNMPIDDIERAMEEVALRETPSLQHNLGALDTIITMAPLLGLLGTITGMIQSFNVVSTAGSGAPAAITGGVAEALIATASGLAVAIFTLPAYNGFTEKVKEVIAEMEVCATELLNIFARHKHEDRATERLETPQNAVIWRDKAVLPSTTEPRF